ncbi:MAG: hypothetical protein P1S60_19300, partial [Anaerolineae bacterium]|nr:hypothetical protein [Anaerolineae bacterium]
PYWRISTSPLESGGLAVAQMLVQKEKEADAEDEDQESNPHLRSSHEVIGYSLHAMDGDMGQIDDFIADDEMWGIRYLVVALKNTKRILSPQWVHKVNWTRQRVTVELEKIAVQMAPEFDPETPVNREYEVKLYDYYGRPKYWSRI